MFANNTQYIDRQHVCREVGDLARNGMLPASYRSARAYKRSGSQESAHYLLHTPSVPSSEEIPAPPPKEIPSTVPIEEPPQEPPIEIPPIEPHDIPPADPTHDRPLRSILN